MISESLTMLAIRMAAESASWPVSERRDPNLMELRWHELVDREVDRGALTVREYVRCPEWRNIKVGYPVDITSLAERLTQR